MAYRSDALKEAIVNKLKEYDAYIDNELPDYILVMLANKKTVSQISQDLELFLGDNTRRFSNWLKGVLEKPELLSPSTNHVNNFGGKRFGWQNMFGGENIGGLSTYTEGNEGRKRSFDAVESKEVENDENKPSHPPSKRKITVRSSTQERKKETSQSPALKQPEIVHETTTHETSHHSGKQSRVSVSSKDEDDDYDEDEPVATTLASVIKRPTTESRPQPSGRILLKAINAIQGNSRSKQSKSEKKSIKQQSEVKESSNNQTDDVASKEVEELPSDDLRRRLGKKTVPSQSDSKNEERSPAADVGKSEAERIVVRPKFVVTMNQVDEKYKTDTDKEVVSNEASDDVSPAIVPERCRFWPNCKNGDICPYYHPSVPCKLFPKCKFGDKCRFIHPICKFNAQCMKPGCLYLHTAPRRKQTLGSGIFPIPAGVMAAPPQMDTVSHYKWNPPGGHHKSNKSNQYVWTSSKMHLSERRFVTTDKPTQMPVSANL